MAGREAYIPSMRSTASADYSGQRCGIRGFYVDAAKGGLVVSGMPCGVRKKPEDKVLNSLRVEGYPDLAVFKPS